MARKTVTNVIFSNMKKAGLKCSLEVAFANYIWMCLENANNMCKW